MATLIYFLNDSFVHIMSIDFVFLTILGALIFKDKSNKYLLDLMPVVGIYYLLAEQEINNKI